MKFETLKSFSKKKLIIPIVIISCLIIVITIFVSHAKYISKDSITIIDDEVNYKPYDFKILGIYQQKENCTEDNCYEEKNVMPSEGYEINEDKSYCYVDDENNKIKNKIYTNSDGEVVIKELPKRSKCYIYFDKLKPASEKTLNQLAQLSQLTSGGVIDTNGFTDVETAVSTGKVYETEDNDGTSYYYRGDVQDNYVKFGKMSLTEDGADIWWRIIRINGDGSIRIIYAGTSTSETAPSQTDKTSIITADEKIEFYYSTERGDINNNMYVGYQYTSGVRNGHTTDSYAKTMVDKWFETNLKDELETEDSKIDVNAGFCGDRSAYSGTTPDTKNDLYGTATQTTYYGAFIRNHPQDKSISSSNPAKPSLECPDIDNDLYTYKNSSKGTKSLEYPIGLITADEVVYAGGLYNRNNTNYYLYNNSRYWTMSPYYSYEKGALVLRVSNLGYLGNDDIYGSYGLRPVLNLSSNSIISGKGIASDPFKLSTYKKVSN